ncbi:MAG: GAF domain-containing protein, partial [Ilumatobacter sp.]|uniref:GAF domain-containing protein n=1 Tax=Ilumatobacter sp. TaxID=1967498 RepID=UPI003C719BFD
MAIRMEQPGDLAAMTDPTESARLASLFSLGLVGSERNERFDRITRLAARALDMPISLVTLLDDTQQFMCSAFGTEPTRTQRTDSFCTHAITEGADMLIVEDARADPRFASLSFVTGPPFVRFYAGASISAPS